MMRRHFVPMREVEGIDRHMRDHARAKNRRQAAGRSDPIGDLTGRLELIFEAEDRYAA